MKLALIYLFVAALKLHGVDLNVQQTNGVIRVWTTNNTFWYTRVEWSATLQTNDWHHWATMFRDPDADPYRNFSFTLRPNQPMTFWRLKDSPLP